MGRVNTPILTEIESKELEKLYKTSANDSLRRRCHLVLLKADNRSSKDVGKIVNMSDVTVNSWLNRYKSEGISGLKIKQGRGRKTIIDKLTDGAEIITLVKNHRQRVETAKAEWESSSGKKASLTTFKLFLKSLAEDINV